MKPQEIEALQIAIRSWAEQEKKARRDANKATKWANTLRDARVKSELQLWLLDATLSLDGIARREIDGCIHLRLGDRECRIPAGGYVVHGRAIKHGKFRTLIQWNTPLDLGAERSARKWLLGNKISPWPEVGARRFIVTGQDKGEDPWSQERTEHEVASVFSAQLGELHLLQVDQELGIGSGILLNLWSVVVKRIA